MTDCTKVPTIQDIEDSKLAMDDIASFTYLAADSFVDAKGVTRDTVNGRLKKMGYDVPVIPYAGGELFTVSDNLKVVEESSVIYAPKPNSLPFTTSGTFIGDDDARFFIVQGLTVLSSGNITDYVFSTVANMVIGLTIGGETISPVSSHIYSVVSTIGYDHYIVSTGLSSNDYNVIDSSTVGFQIKRIEHHQSQDTEGFGAGFGRTFSQRINGRVDDVYLLIQGDSTGDATDEWPYLTAQTLGELYTEHTVKFRFWNDTTEDYDPEVTVSTGSGVYTIYIYNASRPGASIPIYTGSRHDNVYADIEFDLIILNYGHNNQIGNGGIAASIRRNNLLYRNIEVVSQVISDQPQAEIVLTLQNTDSDFPEFTIDQVEAVDRTARVLGCSTIDVRSVFQWKKFVNPPSSDWYRPVDNVHPNLIGSGVWRDIVVHGLLNPSKQALTTINPLGMLNGNLYDPFIIYWDEDTQLPYNVIKEPNAVISKDTTIFETGNSSLKLETNNGVQSFVTMNADDFLSSGIHESGITLAVRVYVPLGVLDENAGQVHCQLSNGGLPGSGYINTEVRDRWHWRIVHIPRNYIDAKDSTSLTLRVNSSATNGEVIYIDRFSVVDGLLPTQPMFIGKYAPDYYIGGNVISLDGTPITITTRNIEVTGDGGSASVCAINFFGLELGRSYTFSWTNPQTVTGVFSIRETIGGFGNSLAAKNYTDGTKTIIWTATRINGSVRCDATNGQGVYNLSTLSIVPN